MMKKTFLIGILAVLFCVSVAFANPCPIPATCAQLRTAIESAGCGVSYTLTCDLNCTGETGLQSICASGYSGTFDGQNHIITGLTIYQPSATSVGFFAKLISGGIIKNVGLVNVNITGNGYQSGVGSLVGEMSSSSVSNSFSIGNVTGTGSTQSDVGCLIGYMKSGSQLTNSFSAGTVISTGAGSQGFVGGMWSSSVNNSFSTCNVTGSFQSRGLTYVFGGGSTVNNFYWNNLTRGPTNCYEGVNPNAGCVAIQNNEAYFKGNVYPTKQPMASWDFNTPIWHQWTNPADYPNLYPQSCVPACTGQQTCTNGVCTGGINQEGSVPEFSSTAIIVIIAIIATVAVFMFRKK